MDRRNDSSGVATMFQWLIQVKPLGFLYGSAGAFLSAENLVGKSGAKFPPDASVMSGLILRTYQEKKPDGVGKIKKELTVAGAFWAKDDDLSDRVFYVPIPRSRTIGEDESAEWEIQDHKWHREQRELQADYSWQRIDDWDNSAEDIRKNGGAKGAWKFNPFLHPQMQSDQRHVLEKDGLFLENAVQMDEDISLVYLSTHKLTNGWYRFGGEGHLVEITSHGLNKDSVINKLLNTPIQRGFALITPGVWGTNNLSKRYPTALKTDYKLSHLLTDRPIPFRYRLGKGTNNETKELKNSSVLGVGRYAVPAGTVYVLKHPLDEKHNTWWKFPNDWFPQSSKTTSSEGENTLLKQLGCGLCLPIKIKGVD